MRVMRNLRSQAKVHVLTTVTNSNDNPISKSIYLIEPKSHFFHSANVMRSIRFYSFFRSIFYSDVQCIIDMRTCTCPAIVDVDA